MILLTKKCRIQLGGPGSLQLTVMLLLEHPQFLGHRKEPSWVLAPQPRRCLHRPSFPQQLHAERTWVCKCCVPNSSPSSVQGLPVPTPVVPGALRHPKFDWGGPGRGTGHSLTSWSLMGCFHPVHPCSATPRTACAGVRLAGHRPCQSRLRQPREPLFLKGQL